MTRKISLLCAFTLLNVVVLSGLGIGKVWAESPLGVPQSTPASRLDQEQRPSPGIPFEQYHQLMVESIHDAFVQKVRQLDGDRHQLRPGIETMRQYHSVALSACGALSQALAGMELSNNSELFQRAFRKFEAGEIEEAQYILSDNELESALRNTYRNGYQPSDPEFQQPLNNYLLKARLSVVQLNMEAASGYYMKAIHADRLNYDNLLEYARFLYKLGDAARALSFAERTFELAESDYQRALAQDLLANIYAWQTAYEQAATAFDQSRNLLDNQEGAVPDMYLIDNVIAMRKRAIRHADHSSPTKAWGIFDQALEICTQLANKYPILFTGELAETHLRFAASYELHGEYELALEQYSLGWELIDDLTAKYPEVYQLNQGLALANIAAIEAQLNRTDIAERRYRAALEAISEISDQLGNPYHPEMGDITNALGELYILQYRFRDGEKLLKDAQRLLQPLAIKYPDAYEFRLAQTFHLRGKIHQLSFDYEEAFRSYEKALKIRQRFAKDDSTIYRLALAESYADIGTLYLSNNQFDLGYRSLNDAMEIYQRIATEMPATYRASLANLLLQSGASYVSTHLYEHGQKVLLESKEILMAAHPIANAGELATCQRQLGRLYLAFDDYASAEREFTGAAALLAVLGSEDSVRYTTSRIRLILDWADFALTTRDPETALIRSEEAVSLLERWVLTNPRSHLSLLVTARRQLAEAHLALGHIERAQEMLLEAMEIQEGLVEVRQEIHSGELAQVCYVLGQTYRAQNEYRQSSVYYLRALDILARLENAYGDWVLPEIVSVRHAFADAYRDYGAYEMATQQYRKAHRAVQRLVPTGRGAFDLERSRIQFGRAQLLMAQKRYEEAFDMYREAANLQQVLADQYAGYHYRELAQTLGDMAWCMVMVQDFEGAQTYIEEAVRLDEAQETLRFKQAPIELLSNNYSEARSIYVEYTDLIPEAREVFLADLTVLEQMGIEHTDIRKVRRLLEK